MKKLDTNRYYKLIGLSKRDVWSKRKASDSILGVILCPTDEHTHPSRDCKGHWLGSFEVIQPSQWGRPAISPIALIGAKLRLIPRNQMEKIDESRQHATAARS